MPQEATRQGACRSGRKMYCSDACRQPGFHRRQRPSDELSLGLPRRLPTSAIVYQCPECDTRFLGQQQRCDKWGCFVVGLASKDPARIATTSSPSPTCSSTRAPLRLHQGGTRGGVGASREPTRPGRSTWTAPTCRSSRSIAVWGGSRDRLDGPRGGDRRAGGRECGRKSGNSSGGRWRWGRCRCRGWCRRVSSLILTSGLSRSVRKISSSETRDGSYCTVISSWVTLMLAMPGRRPSSSCTVSSVS